jgi:competence protein ComEC
MTEISEESPAEIVNALARRPAVTAAICFIVGVVLHALLPPVPIVWLVLVGIVTIAAIIFRRLAAVSCGLLMIGLILGGLSVAQIEAFYYPPNHIGTYAADQPRLAWVEMRIDDEPRLLTDPFSAHPMPPRQVTLASVLRVKTNHGWVDSCGQMMVSISQPHPRLAMGQQVRALGTLERPAPAMNPGQFDWAAYYREQRILTSLHIQAAGNIVILSAARLGPLDWLRLRTRQLLDDGFTAAQSLDHALLRALLLGDADPEMRDVQDEFRHTGTSYQLSLSGMHITVVGGFVFVVCRLLRLRPRWSVAIGYGFILLYGVVTLPSTPIVRSVLLCTFFAIGILLRRTRDPVQLLALSALAMLIYHPADLYSAGFQLGFGTVLGLMIFSRRFLEFTRWLMSDEFALPSFNAPIGKRFVRLARGRFFDLLSIAILAWSLAMPLIIFHFNQLNVWAVLAGLVLAPFVFASLIGGLLKIFLTLLWPTLAPQWAAMAAGPIAAMRFILGWLARLPKSDWQMPQLPLWGLCACYAIYLLCLIPTRYPKLRFTLRFSPVAACLLAILLPLWLDHEHLPGNSLTFTLLSLGAGECGIVETPDGHTLMVDAGSQTDSELLTKCIDPFLRNERISNIDTLLLTHSDYDHISAAAGVAQTYGVQRVLVGDEFGEHAKESATAESLLHALDNLDRSPRAVWPGEQIQIGGGAELDVLWPPPHRLGLPTNETAIVAQIRYAGRSILITGDIQQIAEKELLQHPGALRSDVLIAPHHGSSEVTTPAFVRAVHPSLILSSNAARLTGKQKRFEQMIGEVQLDRTNRCGAITVRIASDGTMSVETYLPQKAAATQPQR